MVEFADSGMPIITGEVARLVGGRISIPDDTVIGHFIHEQPYLSAQIITSIPRIIREVSGGGGDELPIDVLQAAIFNIVALTYKILTEAETVAREG
jgi:hypothetical protein